MTRIPDDPRGDLEGDDPSLPLLDTDYLFDPHAPVDPDVARLEHALAPPRHTPHGRPATPTLDLAVHRKVGRGLAWAAAAGLVLGAGPVWLLERDGPEVSAGRASDAAAPLLHAAGEERPLPERTWLETKDKARDLLLGDVGQFTLGSDSRLEVRRLSAEETRFYLERGRREASVSADAHPRFFQVDTPATRCMDLGCQYTLDVNAAGDAHVEVRTGRVAFENDGREVFVPRGARCHATRAGGAGTPRFVDARSELVAALDRFDAARRAPAAERLVLAEAVLGQARDAKDGLVVWRMLQDADPATAQRANARLHEVAGSVPAAVSPGHVAPNAADRHAWTDVLELEWW